MSIIFPYNKNTLTIGHNISLFVSQVLKLGVGTELKETEDYQEQQVNQFNLSVS